ncbi:MAG: hypothetical protein HY280_02760 [Nitrospinae bacterium]|nr:hypothetical protein [Nitrospinota bacterium]
MWEDVKKYLKVLLNLVREQKNLLFHKLILVNYGDSRDDSYQRIGERYFKAYKEGKISDVADEAISSELDALFRAEEEMDKARRELDEIRARYAAQRKAIIGDGYDVWQRAGAARANAPKIPGQNEPRK